MAARTYKNLVFCRAPVAGPRQRGLKASFGKVLVMRRAGLGRWRGPAATPTRDLVERARQLLFSAGALGARASSAKRYRLSVSPTGRPRFLSWRDGASRRTHLYYHRVNDDRDPFSPPCRWTSSNARCDMSRRHKVVSLGRLIEHLDSGRPESVVAITFDDGYRDNYDNAIPILERHGLPATVFLSTGSLDTREPLWFEILAGAVKTTSVDHLDFETDLPRRLWLRTAEERLRANGALFALLRRMPDRDRHVQLAAFLRELAAPEAAQRTDMMLTWDQVRVHAAGISSAGTASSVSEIDREQADWGRGCKRRIEAELQTPVAHFAYPTAAKGFHPGAKAIRAAVPRRATTVWDWYRSTESLGSAGASRGEGEAASHSKMDWYQLVNG